MLERTEVAGPGGTRGLCGAAIFAGALLLFLLEPMAAKELLPVFGGSAAVWITCLVFFQSALFLGYAYAHWLSRQQSSKVHLFLLGGAVLCALLWVCGIWRAVSWPGPASPVGSILLRLTMSIGAPFIMLAATGPLLQVWLSRIDAGRVPYRLFGLSNLASLMALFAYPFLLEPHLALRWQKIAWLIGFVCFAGLSFVLVQRVPPSPARTGGTNAPELAPEPRSELTTGRFTAILWILLPLAAAMQLSAVTEYLTVNVAAIPLLWILPLATYLLTFILAFGEGFALPALPIWGLLSVLLIALGNFLTRPGMGVPISLALGLFLGELLFAGLACHLELFRLRPVGSEAATMFYLCVAAGGALGATLVGVAAPLLFRGNYDLSLTFAVTAGVLLATSWRSNPKLRLLWAACVVLSLHFSLALQRADAHDTLAAVRNFYGSLRVQESVTEDGDTQRTLMHGTIVHGTEIFTAERMRTPTSYYSADSGIGVALSHCCATGPRRIGVVGLGAGTLAAYGRPGDLMRFYEINPAVLPLAQGYFTYLRQSRADLSFIEGDARAMLAREAPQSYDILVIDAFSGDAIPMHLLTREALAVYRRQLAPGGMLAFHISNQYVDLQPELAALAQAAGLQARGLTSEGDDGRGEMRATWVLMTERPGLFLTPAFARMHTIAQKRNVPAWTDDRSSLEPLMRW